MLSRIRWATPGTTGALKTEGGPRWSRVEPAFEWSPADPGPTAARQTQPKEPQAGSTKIMNRSACSSGHQAKRWPIATSRDPHGKPWGRGVHPSREAAGRTPRVRPGTLPPAAGPGPLGARPAFAERAQQRPAPPTSLSRRAQRPPPASHPQPRAAPASVPLPRRPLATPTSGSGGCWRPCVCPPAPARLLPWVPCSVRSGSGGGPGQRRSPGGPHSFPPRGSYNDNNHYNNYEQTG